MIQVQKGTVSVGKMTISTHQWFISSIPVQSCTKAKILKSGMKSSVSGMRYVRNTPVAKVAEPQNFMRESENAARMLITMVIATTQSDTTTELRKKVRYA